MVKQVIYVMIFMSLILLSGCYCPSYSGGRCPDCNCPSCEPDTRPITKFEYPGNIHLFNEYAELTTEEIIDDYDAQTYLLRINNHNYKNKTDINGSLCIEHKFKEAGISSLSEAPPPEDYKTQDIEYDLNCWRLPIIKYSDMIECELYTEQEMNQNQTVRIFILEG